jgi:hypothetical protein
MLDRTAATSVRIGAWRSDAFQCGLKHFQHLSNPPVALFVAEAHTRFLTR